MNVIFPVTELFTACTEFFEKRLRWLHVVYPHYEESSDCTKKFV